eukprot:g388.t1
MASFAGAPADETSARAQELYATYQRFCAFGKGHRISTTELQMDSRTFQKFCKDVGLLDKRCSKTQIDLIFTKVKGRGMRTIDFDSFITALTMIAQKKRVPFESLISYLLQTHAQPTLTGATAVETVRFHDDKSTYTGVYKRGGPTNLGGGGSGPAITLENLADRSPYDIRGRKLPSRAQQERRRRLSNHGQGLLTSAIEVQNKSAHVAVAQRPATAGAGSYAEQRARRMRTQAGRAKGGNIFDRLTDSSQYTGTHKHRFDSSGRGRGMDGRDRIMKGTGHMGAPRTNFVGNTNTKTDQIFHDSSQFLMR